MNEETQKEFEDLSKPLIEFLKKNFHPHTTIIVTQTDAEVLEGVMVCSVATE